MEDPSVILVGPAARPGGRVRHAVPRLGLHLPRHQLAVETLPPLLMAGFRFILAGLMLYTILRLRGVPAPSFAAVAAGAADGGGCCSWAATPGDVGATDRCRRAGPP